MFLKKRIGKSTDAYWDELARLQEALEQADALLIGAGSGLSASAGLSYSGERFERYFADFQEKYGINDMYSGGFYPFDSLEEYWAWWSRHIWWNRYEPQTNTTYSDLFALVKDQDYFVLTTNVDHQFQLNGFDKKRLFYTQGDYGLFQCSRACHQKTYDNKAHIEKMLREQQNMAVPAALIPYCPVCGAPMTINLRCDDTFVQDEGWYCASERYTDFIRRHAHLPVLFLELGVGMNTPGIIKYPFWQMTAQNPNAVYACLNSGQAVCPGAIQRQSICIDGDAGILLQALLAPEESYE